MKRIAWFSLGWLALFTVDDLYADTSSNITTNEHEGREVVEYLGMDFLRRYTLMLDEYEILPNARDDVASFLNWISQRP